MTVKLAVNVPLRIQIQKAGRSPGKVWQGKQLPEQVWVWGPQDGIPEPDYLYLPVECASALIGHGAKPKQVGEKLFYDLPDTTEWWTAAAMQAAGEKHPTTTLTPPTNGKVEVPVAKHVEAGPGKPAEPVSEDADAQLVRIWKDTLNEVMAATNGRLEDGAVMSGVSTLFIARSKLVVKSGW